MYFDQRRASRSAATPQRHRDDVERPRERYLRTDPRLGPDASRSNGHGATATNGGWDSSGRGDARPHASLGRSWEMDETTTRATVLFVHYTFTKQALKVTEDMEA